MAKYGALDTRMKTFYEQIPKTRLMRRTPVAIRLDGKAFHTFTRSLKKPFDEIFIKAMQDTMKYCCANIQGCVFGYCQSDEITLILVDYQTLTNSAWFDYEVQKMCSVSASMATLEFNRAFAKRVEEWRKEVYWPAQSRFSFDKEDIAKYSKILDKAITRGGEFDSRCFNIPKEEVTNLIFWRQNDASKNSVQMVGRAYFSSAELHKKTTSDIQDMLHEKFGINWNNFPTEQKRGAACIRAEKGWIIDHEMPILKGEGRAYVDNLIYIGEDENPKGKGRVCIAKIDPKSLVKPACRSKEE